MTDCRGEVFLKIAHRGASAYEPENTLRSFEKAIRMGADMIELDVRRTLDGKIAVIHDKRVNRTTNGRGRVGYKTFSELRKLDAGHGERIPRLEEVLELGKGRTRFVIELKENGIEQKVLELLREYSIAGDVFLVSFKAPRLRLVKEIEPGVRTGLILFASSDPVSRAASCGADAVAPFNWFVSDTLVERAHKKSLGVFTWTVDNTKRARRLKDMGVNGIVTNRPDLI